MPLVVVDANVVVSAAMKSDSAPARALLAAMTEDRLAISAGVEAEYREVLSRPKFAKVFPGSRRESFLSAMLANAVVFEPLIRVQDCRDPDDDKYLELALVAHADVIVSGDADLLDLSPWRGVAILSVFDYLRAITGRNA